MASGRAVWVRPNAIAFVEQDHRHSAAMRLSKDTGVYDVSRSKMATIHEIRRLPTVGPNLEKVFSLRTTSSVSPKAKG